MMRKLQTQAKRNTLILLLAAGSVLMLPVVQRQLKDLVSKFRNILHLRSLIAQESLIMKNLLEKLRLNEKVKEQIKILTFSHRSGNGINGFGGKDSEFNFLAGSAGGGGIALLLKMLFKSFQFGVKEDLDPNCENEINQWINRKVNNIDKLRTIINKFQSSRAAKASMKTIASIIAMLNQLSAGKGGSTKEEKPSSDNKRKASPEPHQPQPTHQPEQPEQLRPEKKRRLREKENLKKDNLRDSQREIRDIVTQEINNALAQQQVEIAKAATDRANIPIPEAQVSNMVFKDDQLEELTVTIDGIKHEGLRPLVIEGNTQNMWIIVTEGCFNDVERRYKLNGKKTINIGAALSVENWVNLLISKKSAICMFAVQKNIKPYGPIMYTSATPLRYKVSNTKCVR